MRARTNLTSSVCFERQQDITGVLPLHDCFSAPGCWWRVTRAAHPPHLAPSLLHSFYLLSDLMVSCLASSPLAETRAAATGSAGTSAVEGVKSAMHRVSEGARDARDELKSELKASRS